ncbi:hypothetical protein HDV02_001346 [Globomyces sp. JEL0801]|nr:hypothetical protein HDV02_001346 [Globomyces sp. JEL0801]
MQILKRWFSNLGLHSDLVKAAAAIGAHIPSDIQSKAIPVILSNSHTIIHSETGSGKTLAYLLPLLSKLPSIVRKSPNHLSPKLLILVPSHHLQMQLMQVLDKLTQNMPNPPTIAIYPPSNSLVHLHPVDIGISSSGLILERYKKPKNFVRLFENTRLVCLDEADESLVTLDGRKFLNRAIQALQKLKELPHSQFVFSAATLPRSDSKNSKAPENILRKMFRNINHVHSKNFENLPTGLIEQSIICEELTWKRKYKELLELVKKSQGKQQWLVFCDSPASVDKLTADLEEDVKNITNVKAKVQPINSRIMKHERTQSILDLLNNQPAENELHMVIATDILARGLDFENVSSIIHFDAPRTAIDFRHRVGRTCRQEGQIGYCK